MESKFSGEEIAAMRQTLFDEGIVDEQFTYLEELDDEGNFIEEFTTLYISDATKLLVSVQKMFCDPQSNANEINRTLHQLKGTSASVGAARVKTEVEEARTCLEKGDIQGASASFEKVLKEHEVFKARLESYIKMLVQAAPAPISAPEVKESEMVGGSD